MAGAPYSYETMQNAEDAGRTSFRIRDSADNRVATCYLESNARTIVQALNYEADHSGVEWVCGHRATGMCSECHRELAAKAATLQAEYDLALDTLARMSAKSDE